MFVISKIVIVTVFLTSQSALCIDVIIAIFNRKWMKAKNSAYIGSVTLFYVELIFFNGFRFFV